jgi:hypothetical protein
MTTNNNDKLIERILNVMQYGTSYYDDHLYKATGHDDYLEYKFALDELIHEKLVEINTGIHPDSISPSVGIPSSLTYIDEISLTIVGKRIKDSGGWVRFKRIKLIKNGLKWFIAIGTFVLAGIGVYLDLNPYDKHIDTTDTNNTLKQEETKISSDTLPISEQPIQIDSVETDSLGQRIKGEK